MLQPSDNSQKPSTQFSSTPNSLAPGKTVGTPMEQAMIGRSLSIKGEVSGSESLYVDGRIEGSISIPDSRVTIGRNGSVAANIAAREVVIMGKVHGNIQCSDRLDSLTGDVTKQRISVEDGAVLKGSVQVRSAEIKHDKTQSQAQQNQAKTAEQTKPLAAAAHA